MVFVASPVRNCAEICVAQCSKNLTSSINKLDNKNNHTSFLPSFGFAK